jgi:4-hydroxy-3-methylbut-2-en-1-yl diphosphate reductase
MMMISIEEKSGFCFGVVRAVKQADTILDRGEELFCLGQIVHNELEVKRLSAKGLKFVTNEDLSRLFNCKLLLRAHGEPPETYEIAEKNNIEIIDGTCPIVKRIQNRIKKDGINEESDRVQVIIFGKSNHAEVRGLRAQVPEKTIVIGTEKEADEIQLLTKVHLYAQTTMDSEKYFNIASIIKKRLEKTGGELVINNTICGHVSHRKPGLVKFARKHDLIIFMGGSNSSNGRMLFEACKEENENCHYITDPEDIRKDWFIDVESVGISGATSTPRWQLEKVAEKVKEITGDGQ